jgi:hypothetical protein
MKYMVRIAVIAMTIAHTAGCQKMADQPEVAQVDIERARATLAPFKEQLVDALTGALGEGGPETAIHVCREQAPEIAAQLSVGGVRMGRTSHKTRNPANAPEPWVEPLLAAYLENPEDSNPRAVYVDASTVGYVEPIYVMSFCLSCHGPRIDPELLAEIQSVYPEDRATGFKAGDLRGLFWVTLPRGEEGAGA